MTLTGVLDALSDPTRLEIVRRLAAEGERPCGNFDLPASAPSLSYHFKVLREAGVIVQRREGTRRINCLRRSDLERRFPGLLEAVLRAAAPISL